MRWYVPLDEVHQRIAFVYPDEAQERRMGRIITMNVLTQENQWRAPVAVSSGSS